MEEGLFTVIALGALGLGIFIGLRPQKIIAIQKKFYSFINWNIEPVSLAKEIRNTRIMGMILIVFVIGCCVYTWMR